MKLHSEHGAVSSRDISSRKLKVLIVDDEIGIRETLMEYLEAPEYDFKLASSGNSALTLMENESFDLIVSDIRMPDGDGIFLLDQIKQKNRETPVVLLMTAFSEVDRQTVLKKGAADLLAKPLDYEAVSKFLQDQHRKLRVSA